VLGYWTSATVTGLLFGIPDGDAMTFIAPATILAFIGLAAGAIPAARAARMDPARILRDG
jgi:ABC-type antimicrobial peptide transport system permease subunit